MSLVTQQEDQLALVRQEEHRRETLNQLASRARMGTVDNFVWWGGRGILGGAKRLPASGTGEPTASFDGKSLVVRKVHFTS
mmetsp:Transcript_19057/g.44814  ORF Transcript_19057/g.44814 Transcript_19057/m.44814 type:complete len:81 (+) Transcript_19057:60-302(+)